METQQKIVELSDALQDIAHGAWMMLQSPTMQPVHRYAAEVQRVAEAALLRTNTPGE